MKRIPFFALMCLACLSAITAKAQAPVHNLPDGILQNCPTPVQWEDNNTILMAKGGFEGRTFYKENILTGECVEAQAPVRPIDKLDVKLPDNAKNPQLSPDGAYVAYTLNNDLYATEVATGKVIRYTTDGSEVILNGWASWVYYEEILGRSSQYCSFWWSPDSRHLAFMRCDDTNVPMFPIYVAEGQHGYVERTRYPEAGDPNPEVKLGIVPAEGGAIVWAPFDPKDDQYFGTPFWAPDSKNLWVQWMNRDQDHLILYTVDPVAGTKAKVYEEKVDTWLDWVASPIFMEKGFLMVRDFEKWQQVYLCPWDGSAITRLTDGKNWGLNIIGTDAKTNTLFYTARAEISTRTDVYSVALPNGKKSWKPEPKRLSSGEFNYSGVLFSPDFKYFVAGYSNVATPQQVALFSVKKGLVRVMGDSKGPLYDQYLAQGDIPQTTLHFITTEDGFTIPATVTLPLHMDKNKKYPVIVSIYGGPDAGSVMDRWSNPERSYKWASKGVIQVDLDHRGSGHCGKIGMDMMHRDLGHWEIHDYKLWIDYLRTIAPVDPDKVGITGYSYGGYISALAVITAGDYFQFGIAGAGVHDWSLYDTHYGERFMDTPKDNPEGYKSSSVIQNAAKYNTFGKKSVLCLTHGTSDDNVHFQNSIQLVDALMATGQHFEFMMYPAARHGYRGYQAVFSDSEEDAFWTRYLLEE